MFQVEKLINIATIGDEHLLELIAELTEHVEHFTPVEFNENNRNLVRGETQFSGPMDFSLTPHWIKPLNSLDPHHPAREISVKKGVKTSFNSTAIEGGLLYLAAHLRAFPGMFVTADKELAQSRTKTHIIPMFQNSGFGNIFRSNDELSHNKTGKTKDLLEWLGGGNLVLEGARNADKMRMFIAMFLFLDELDTFAVSIGMDGNTVKLLKDRCATFWEVRKIIMGSTPKLRGSSNIDIEFNRGDQQSYFCACLKCGYQMPLRWQHGDLTNTEKERGMQWDYVGENFDPLSIRYECWNCGNGHEESHKEKFINKDNCEWQAQAVPVEFGIESYHMPAALSRLQPWSKLVGNWHDAFTKAGKVKSLENMQVFYNNVLGESFEVIGTKLAFSAASGHRREFYCKGQIPNNHIEQYCKSHVMFVCMTVDVHLHFLAATTWGFTVGGNAWIIDYKIFKDESENGTLDIESPAWTEVQALIDEKEYISDDHKSYMIEISLIDCSWGDSDAVVSEFCAQFEGHVYPLKGDNKSKSRIKSFYKYNTAAGVDAYMVAVDHYKDMLAPVLRRRWTPEDGDQPRHHFNAPTDLSDKALRELTKEFKKEVRNKSGEMVSVWFRPPGSRNELWDLFVYAHACLDILATLTCVGNLELEGLDFPAFWQECEDAPLFYVDESAT